MALPYLPHPGEILICDFDDVAVGAEMVKCRPVVVISRKDAHRSQLCCVVPLSTTAPTPPKAWHHLMSTLKIWGWPAEEGVWAKCDMLATVSLLRLNQPYRKTRDGRKFIPHAVAPVDLGAIRACVRSYLQIP